jgi:hypothetical protein
MKVVALVAAGGVQRLTYRIDATTTLGKRACANCAKGHGNGERDNWKCSFTSDHSLMPRMSAAS